MNHRTLAYALALMTSTLALNGPAQADTVDPLRWIQTIETPEDITDFTEFSLLSLTFDNKTTHFSIQNNTIDNLRLRRSMDFIVCDGSVRVVYSIDVLCDGSVTPQGLLQLSLSSTINPSITMSGTFWDATATGNQTFGIVVGTGLSLTDGTTLTGLFESGSLTVAQMATQTTVIDPPLNPVQSIAVRTAVPDRNFYLIGQVDGEIMHTSAKDDTPIAQGTTRVFTPDKASEPYTCQYCTTFYTGVGFASPGKGGLTMPVDGAQVPIYGTRTQFQVTFRVTKVTTPPPAVIPLPAAGWLLLGGLGALGLASRRQRRRG